MDAVKEKAKRIYWLREALAWYADERDWATTMDIRVAAAALAGDESNG